MFHFFSTVESEALVEGCGFWEQVFDFDKYGQSGSPLPQSNTEDRTINAQEKTGESHGNGRVLPEYPCPKCDQKFSNYISLGNHLRDVHKFKGFPCKYCGIRMSRPDNLKPHYRICKKLPASERPVVPQTVKPNRRPPETRRVSTKTLRPKPVSPQTIPVLNASILSGSSPPATPPAAEAASLQPDAQEMLTPSLSEVMDYGLQPSETSSAPGFLPAQTVPTLFFNANRPSLFDPQTENDLEVLRREYFELQRLLQVRTFEFEIWRDLCFQQMQGQRRPPDQH